MQDNKGVLVRQHLAEGKGDAPVGMSRLFGFDCRYILSSVASVMGEGTVSSILGTGHSPNFEEEVLKT